MKTHFIVLNRIPDSPLIFDKGEKYIVFFYNLSGSLTLTIKSRNTEVYAYGLYTGKSDNSYQIRTKQHHLVAGSTSDLLIKGIFRDTSRFFFDGLIRIEKKASESHAYQKNQNVIMSDSSTVISQPNLEILTSDVFCTHASTTGRLNEEEILYMQMKGINRSDASSILIRGFIQDLFNEIAQKGIDRSQLDPLLQKVIDNYD